MSRPIRLNIDVTKLNQDWFYKGQKGTYVSLAIWPNRNGPDQFGNDVSVQQDPPRDTPKDAPKLYVGNGKYFGQQQGGGGGNSWGNDGGQRQQGGGGKNHGWQAGFGKSPPPQKEEAYTPPFDDSSIPF